MKIKCTSCGHEFDVEKSKQRLLLDKRKGRLPVCPQCGEETSLPFEDDSYDDDELDGMEVGGYPDEIEEDSENINMNSGTMQIKFNDVTNKPKPKQRLLNNIRMLRKKSQEQAEDDSNDDEEMNIEVDSEANEFIEDAVQKIVVYCTRCGQKLTTTKKYSEIVGRSMSCPRCSNPVQFIPPQNHPLEPVDNTEPVLEEGSSEASAMSETHPSNAPRFGTVKPLSKRGKYVSGRNKIKPASGDAPSASSARVLSSRGESDHTSSKRKKQSNQEIVNQLKKILPYAAPVVVIGVIVLFALAFHKTWEEHSYNRIIKLSESVYAASNLDQMQLRLADLDKYIGENELTDPQLIETVDKARDSVEAAKQRIKDLEVLTEITLLEARAREQAEKGKALDGVATLRQAQMLISQTNTSNNPEFVDANVRITQTIDQYSNHPENVINSVSTAGGRAMPVASNAQNMRGQPTASSGEPAIVEGSVWMCLGAGDIVTVNELTVMALPRQISKTELVNGYNMALQYAQSDYDELTESKEMREEKDINRAAEESVIYIKTLPFHLITDKDAQREEHRAKLEKKYKEQRKKQEDDAAMRLAVLSKSMKLVESLPEGNSVDQNLINTLFMRGMTDRLRETLGFFFMPQVKGKAVSGRDGKFTLSLPEGDYYLYAEENDDEHEVRWFLPVSLKGGETTPVALNNVTACILKIHGDDPQENQ